MTTHIAIENASRCTEVTKSTDVKTTPPHTATRHRTLRGTSLENNSVNSNTDLRFVLFARWNEGKDVTRHSFLPAEFNEDCGRMD